MRRLIAAVVVALVALSLWGCSSPPTAQEISSTALATAPPTAQPTASATASDPLSPTEVVEPYQQFPTKGIQLPNVVADALAAKRPMMLYWYDPSTTASKDQRAAIDAVMEDYRGLIDLITIDFTAGIPTSASQATTLPAEVTKIELMTAQLKVHTTPYVMFVDRYGRITGRFAGFTDAKLLERETIRATQ